jgi:DNA-binding transcriptional MocR family regulator
MSAGDYDRHLQRLRRKLREQRQRTATAIASYCPSGTRFSQPKGGLALWVELPDEISSQSVFESALDAGILIAPGLMFSNSNRYDHFVRLNCGMPYTPEVDQALREVGAILHRLVRDAEARHSNADSVRTAEQR